MTAPRVVAVVGAESLRLGRGTSPECCLEDFGSQAKYRTMLNGIFEGNREFFSVFDFSNDWTELSEAHRLPDGYLP